MLQNKLISNLLPYLNNSNLTLPKANGANAGMLVVATFASESWEALSDPSRKIVQGSP